MESTCSNVKNTLTKVDLQKGIELLTKYTTEEYDYSKGNPTHIVKSDGLYGIRLISIKTGKDETHEIAEKMGLIRERKNITPKLHNNGD